MRSFILTSSFICMLDLLAEKMQLLSHYSKLLRKSVQRTEDKKDSSTSQDSVTSNHHDGTTSSLTNSSKSMPKSKESGSADLLCLKSNLTKTYVNSQRSTILTFPPRLILCEKMKNQIIIGRII